MIELPINGYSLDRNASFYAGGMFIQTQYYNNLQNILTSSFLNC